MNTRSFRSTCWIFGGTFGIRTAYADAVASGSQRRISTITVANVPHAGKWTCRENIISREAARVDRPKMAHRAKCPEFRSVKSVSRGYRSKRSGRSNKRVCTNCGSWFSIAV